jgi:3-phosphoshikimate 1-carboxyvinyltransferase
MDVRIAPRTLSGDVAAAASKSQAHRMLICAALADRPTAVRLSSGNADIDATLACLRALGAKVNAEQDNTVRVEPVLTPPDFAALDCAESGSTLRFLLPVAAALCGRARFMGAGRLPERPLSPLLDALCAHGCSVTAQTLPLEISGQLCAGTYALPGNVSSQFVSGLLFALPLLDGGSRIELSSPLESAAYADMTVRALARFGVQVTRTETGFDIREISAIARPAKLTLKATGRTRRFFWPPGRWGTGYACRIFPGIHRRATGKLFRCFAFSARTSRRSPAPSVRPAG